VKGKWAAGIPPRNFTWVIKDRLAMSERPGGFAPNHRKVRRQEEIIWLQVQGFNRVVSLLPSSHNLQAYEEKSLASVHYPLPASGDVRGVLAEVYRDVHGRLTAGERILIHQEELGVPPAVRSPGRHRGRTPDRPPHGAVGSGAGGRRRAADPGRRSARHGYLPVGLMPGVPSGDRIELRGLRSVGTHGVLVEEQERAQPFEVDLDLAVDLRPAGVSDSLADTVDYGAVADVVAATVSGTRSFALLEALAWHVADAVLGVDHRITGVTVVLRKLRPPVAVDIDTVGVRVVRTR
jgi:dihydroneopterin aldolase